MALLLSDLANNPAKVERHPPVGRPRLETRGVEEAQEGD